LATNRQAWTLQALGPGLASWVCLGFMLPVLMVASTKSSPAALAIASLLALIDTTRLADWRSSVRNRLAVLLHRPDLALVLAALLLMLGSIPFAHRPSASFHQSLQMLAPLVSIGVLAVVQPVLAVPARTVFFILAVGVAIGAGLVVFDILSGLPLRALFGGREMVYAYNRTIVTFSLLAWPMLAWFWLHGPRYGAIGAGLVLVPVLMGDSGAAIVGIVLAMLVFAVASFAPAAVRRAGLGLSLIGLAIAPFAASLLSRLMTPEMHQRLKGAHTEHRMEILTAYEAVIQKSRFLGHGFGSSLDINLSPVARQLPPELMPGLTSHHPHNAFVQIWVEHGLLGASIAAVLLTMAFLGIGRMPVRLQPFILAWLAGILGIALVSHGAWQAWWIAGIGVSALLFNVIARHSAGKS
jgi:exopolysaccharide production protein ExoQ